MTGADGSAWDDQRWKRRLETFGDDDSPVLAAKKREEADAIWSVTLCRWESQRECMLML